MKQSETRLMARDAMIVDSLKRFGLLTGRQIQQLWFSVENYTACKRRLTKLHNSGIIKRLSRDSVNDPYVYFVGRTPRAVAIQDHQLGINEIRVRVERAVRELGWQLIDWQTPETLQAMLSRRVKLAPDGYFRISREVDGTVRNSGFFLEYEHTVRPSRVLQHKLTRYADLYHSGEFSKLFGIRGMRVLVVYNSTPLASADKRCLFGLEVAKRVGFPPICFSTLEAIKANTPMDLLYKPLWLRPDQTQLVALY